MASPSAITPILLTLALVGPAFTNSCLGPTVTHSIYTSTEAPLARSTVIIVSFDLECKNELEDKPNLYATINGKTLPTARTEDGKYQVSIVEEHAAAPKGTYTVGIYDEDGYASLKKAQRSEEGSGVEAVAPIASFDFKHAGVATQGVIQSEVVALGFAILLFYLVHSAKANIEESS